MKILLVDMSSGIGGAQISLYLIAKSLKNSNNKCKVVVPGYGGFHQLLKDNKIKVEIINIQSWRLWIDSFSNIVLGILSFPLTIISLIKWIFYYQSDRPDIVHLNLNRIIEPLIAAKILKIPTVVHFRDLIFDVDVKFIFGSKLFFYIMNLANVWIANSVTCKKYIYPYTKKPLFIVPNAVDINDYTWINYKKNTTEKDDLYVNIINLGGIQPWKNQLEFIEMAILLLQNNKKLKFYVVGPTIDQEYKNRLDEVIMNSGFGNNIIFTGSQNNIPKILSQMDILVHNNINESFGRIYIEAMAAGIPVVTYNSDIAKEILSNGRAGVLTPIGDRSKMVLAITELINSSKKRIKIGKFGRAKVRNEYSVDKQFKKINNIYNKILTDKYE